jgi:hypothetical protein
MCEIRRNHHSLAKIGENDDRSSIVEGRGWWASNRGKPGKVGARFPEFQDGGIASELRQDCQHSPALIAPMRSGDSLEYSTEQRLAEVVGCQEICQVREHLRI